MSYSIVLFSNLILHILKIIWMLKIFNNFSSWDIDFPNGKINLILFFKLLNFTKLLITANYLILILVAKFLRNWLIFQIRNFWNGKFLDGMVNGNYRMIKCRTTGVSEWQNYEY